MPRTSPAAVLALCLAAMVSLGSCRSAYYGALERVGVHKRDILKDRVEAGREAQEEAREQFQTTYERLQEVSGAGGSELEERYRHLSSEYERSEARAQEVRERIRAIDQVAGDLFSEWEAEAREITNSQLRRASERSLRDTKSRYAELIAAMRRAEASMDPVLVAFRDQVLFLKHNLNAQAVAALQGTLLSIERDVADLIEEMEASIREARAFTQSLEG